MLHDLIQKRMIEASEMDLGSANRDAEKIERVKEWKKLLTK